ncbi:hypothetical protein, partial [Streptomyces panacea]|uniref:hypothetical protein n=1 Tax=Streptomyces panacea TaxID=3035064 RepID=UPI00339C5C80
DRAGGAGRYGRAPRFGTHPPPCDHGLVHDGSPPGAGPFVAAWASLYGLESTPRGQLRRSGRI